MIPTTRLMSSLRISNVSNTEVKNVLRSIQQMFTLPKEVNTKLTSCSRLGFGDSKQKSTQGNVNQGGCLFLDFFHLWNFLQTLQSMSCIQNTHHIL